MNALDTTANHTSIFNTKEEYIDFRKRWKELHAEGYHRPVRKEYQHGGAYHPDGGTNKYGNPTWSYTPGSTGFFMVSPLTTWHHLVFNLAVGRDPFAKAFRPVERPKNASRLWHSIAYTNGAPHTYDLFGDALTPEQKKTLDRKIADFLKTI